MPTPDTLADDMLYGAAEIGAFIGRNKDQVFYMFRKKHPAISKEPGAGLVARKSFLRQHFGLGPDEQKEEEQP